MLDVIHGDCRQALDEMKRRSVQACVCSPPYMGLRDYKLPPLVWGGQMGHKHVWGTEIQGSNRGGSGTPNGRNNRGEGYGRAVARGNFCKCGAWRGSLGLEPAPDLYIEHLVEVFRTVRRVLRNDGTLWIVIGDSYASQWPCSRVNKIGLGSLADGKRRARPPRMGEGLKEKDLIGIPWMLAFALRNDGWYLRQDIIWRKINCLPESVADRCTRSHEHILLLTKSQDYYFDAKAISEPLTRPDEATRKTPGRFGGADKHDKVGSRLHSGNEYRGTKDGMRNRRDVWTIGIEPNRTSHCAAFPTALADLMIRAGCPRGELVLDPFAGISRTGLACLAAGRGYIGIELNKKYIEEGREEERKFMEKHEKLWRREMRKAKR